LENVSDTTTRALQLLSLLQTGNFWPGTELAERFDVSVRTLRRDVDRLRELGYPIEATTGPGGGYRLALTGSLPPLVVDDDEAVALVVGLRSAAARGVSGLEATSGRALVKVKQALPSRLRRDFAAVASHIVPLVPETPSVSPRDVTTVARACRDRERLHFDYRNRDRQATRRSVDPHSLVLFQYRWYLVAWDIDRNDWRTFRLDRLGAIEGRGLIVPPRELPGGDAAEFVANSIQRTIAQATAVVVLHAPLAIVADRLPVGAGQLELIDEGRCRLRTDAHSLAWLAVNIAMLDVDFDVESPPELIEHVAALARRWTAAAERSHRAGRDRVPAD
jgi:predicted DNA-binding transcriptional regulator YafY